MRDRTYSPFAVILITIKKADKLLFKYLDASGKAREHNFLGY